MKSSSFSVSNASRHKAIFFALILFINIFFGVSSFAQNPEPNSIGIYFTPLYEDSLQLKPPFSSTISTTLSDIPGLRVLERVKIKKIQDEIELSSSGLTSTETSVKKGIIMIPERILNITGINHYTFNGIALNAYENYSVTDFKTGKISFSSNTANFSASNLDDIKKVANRTYKSKAETFAKQDRAIRTVSVDLPVDYDFKFKGIFPEEGEAPVVRESNEFFVLKDGQTTDKKKNNLSFACLSGGEGLYKPEGFTVFFDYDRLTNSHIWLKGKYNKDKSRLEFVEIHRSRFYLLKFDEHFQRIETSTDMVRAENLVLKPSSLGATYEFVSGTSKIAELDSKIIFSEDAEMPLRSLKATHTANGIDNNQLDYFKKKVEPKIYMMTGTENPPAPVKPYTKIYLRGNWTGYAFITEKILNKFPNAELIDQTETFQNKIKSEKNLNKESGKILVLASMDFPASPGANEAIINFNSQSQDNGAKKIDFEVITSTRNNKFSINQPKLYSQEFPQDEKSKLEEEKGTSIAVEFLYQQAEFLYLQIEKVGKDIVNELNK